MKIEFANSIPMRRILFKLELEPISEIDGIITYVSPLSATRNTTLCVDEATNTWFDSCLSIRGRVCDFVCAYLKSIGEADTIEDALRWLKNMMCTPPRVDTSLFPNHSIEDQKYKVRSILPLTHYLLLQYLDAQFIPRNIASLHLKEVRVANTETRKLFRAIGLRNEEGGYAVFNQLLHAQVGLSTITFIRGTKIKPSAISVFHNALDFLSVLAHRKGRAFESDVIILNDYQCVNDAIPYIRDYGYERVYTWLANTPYGFKLTGAYKSLFLAVNAIKVYPMNSLYKGFPDVSQWWQSLCGKQ